jgi:hypothetical protein
LADLRAFPNQYKDWIVTSAFYCAIHAVMAHFHDHVNQYDHEKGLPQRRRYRNEGLLWGHPHRKKMVQENLKPLFRVYNELETLARNGRYDHLDLDFVPEEKLEEFERTLDEDFLKLP